MVDTGGVEGVTIQFHERFNQSLGIIARELLRRDSQAEWAGVEREAGTRIRREVEREADEVRNGPGPKLDDLFEGGRRRAVEAEPRRPERG